MDILTTAYDLVIGYILPFLFVLTIVVFFHELGHFLVARWCNVKVSDFSVGFGREIFGFNDRHGTRWKLSLIPLGGYVKFAGDENAASVPDRDLLAQMSAEERRTAFVAKPVWQRAAVVAAGPFANFLLAIAIFTFIFMVFGKTVTAPIVDEVRENSAAEAAGLLPGDEILAVNGRGIETFNDLQRIVSASAEVPLELEVARGTTVLSITAVPQYREVTDNFGNSQRIGLLGITRSVDQNSLIQKDFGPLEAVAEGTRDTVYVAGRTLDYIWGVISGRESADQLGGPIRVAHVSGQVADQGLLPLLSLAAVLSISIGLINLMPIPMLDGGHLVYYAAEAVRGKPLSERVQEIGFRVGLGIVLFLMVFATWNDVLHLSRL
ncbi:putative zinc metalloprotease [Roseibium aquae]|uniref:Zinc metalloprotease n=1 Tax=Roseibium aquae TaxID=1323746 RepID=A0A916X280_9HYPH|nr:RIP metalloprotease RseP [Roseibium aquae]GGB60357.1 putative zinc metalloprotease [Roseibium aquae]